MSGIDIGPISPDQLDPDLRAPTLAMRTGDPTSAAMRTLAAVAMRVMRFPRAEGVSIRTVRDRGLDLRIYEPEVRRNRGALLWIHGGGLVIGDAKQDEPLASGTAATLGIPVVSANYRLAPRHPFPAAYDDVARAWEWLLAHTDELSVAGDRLAIGGESAGAGLAAALINRIHDGGGAQPSAQWLFAPMLDDRTAAGTDLDARAHFIWDNTKNRFGWRSYLAAAPGADSVPEAAAAARRADLSGLPPTFITVGSIELFHDEDVAYAHRLRDAGVDTTLDIVPGAPHGFENWARDTAPAVALLDRARTWLTAYV